MDRDAGLWTRLCHDIIFLQSQQYHSYSRCCMQKNLAWTRNQIPGLSPAREAFNRPVSGGWKGRAATRKSRRNSLGHCCNQWNHRKQKMHENRTQHSMLKCNIYIFSCTLCFAWNSAWNSGTSTLKKYTSVQWIINQSFTSNARHFFVFPIQ